MKPTTNSGTGVPPVCFKQARLKKQPVPDEAAGPNAPPNVLLQRAAGCLLGIFVMLAAWSSGAQSSPISQADSASFILNTTASTENGTQVATDTPVFLLNTTGTVGAQTDSLDFVIDTRAAAPVAFSIRNPVALAGAGFRFSFTNTGGFTFRVFATTNLSIAFSNWIFVGTVTDQPPGSYQFNDPQMTNYARRYYQVISP